MRKTGNSREERLAEALRANLQRRKAQARSRKATPQTEGGAHADTASDAMEPPTDGPKD